MILHKKPLDSSYGYSTAFCTYQPASLLSYFYIVNSKEHTVLGQKGHFCITREPNQLQIYTYHTR